MGLAGPAVAEVTTLYIFFAGAVHVAAGRVVRLMVSCFVCLSVYCHFRI